MLRAPRVIAAAVLLALLMLVAPIAPAGAQDTVDLYIVHALNLDGQDDQDDGLTPITWCNDDQLADPNWEFGEVWSAIGWPGGAMSNNQLYLGANVDCANPGGALLLADQTMTLPASGRVLWVITSPPGGDPSEETEIVEYPLDASCLDASNGRSTFVHAAATGPLDLEFDGQDGGTISFGQQTNDDVPPGTYDFEVSGGAAWAGPVDITAGEYVTGVAAGVLPLDPDTPFVILGVIIDPIELCPPPPTSTTTTTTAVPATTAAAQPAALQPTFTG